MHQSLHITLKLFASGLIVIFLTTIRNGDLTGAISYSNKSLEGLTPGADAVFAGLFFTRMCLLILIKKKKPCRKNKSK